MTENKPITVYTADCIGNAVNCRYPNEVNITDEITAKSAFSKDMVCAKYKNGHRSVLNFETANALPMDCDNDHSDIPAAWITPEDVAEFFAATMRNQKEEKDPAHDSISFSGLTRSRM